MTWRTVALAPWQRAARPGATAKRHGPDRWTYAAIPASPACGARLRFQDRLAPGASVCLQLKMTGDGCRPGHPDSFRVPPACGGRAARAAFLRFRARSRFMASRQACPCLETAWRRDARSHVAAKTVTQKPAGDGCRRRSRFGRCHRRQAIRSGHARAARHPSERASRSTWQRAMRRAGDRRKAMSGQRDIWCVPGFRPVGHMLRFHASRPVDVWWDFRAS